MDEKAKLPESQEAPSRRSFLRTPAAAGAVAAVMATQGKIFAATTQSTIPSIKIPKEIPANLAEAPNPGSFEGKGMTGAEVFARLCKEEELAAMFCCPGNYTVINAIAAANSARTPLLVLASNMQISGDDREAFIQTGYQQPTTTGMKKYGKRLIAPDRVWEYGAYAFRNMKSGVPGPCHLDFPGEVARAKFTDPANLKDFYGKDKYRTESRPHPSSKDMEKAVDMISKAERPMLIAGQGIFQRKAYDTLLGIVNKHEMAVCGSGPMRGQFPDEHRLSASLSPDALMSADLVIFVGQYCMPSPGEYRFNPDIKAIRVHPVQEDLGRNWPLDLGIVSDEKVFLEELANRLPAKKRDAWVNELAAARAKYEKTNLDHYALGLKHSQTTGMVHPAVMAKEVHDFLYKGDIDPKQTVTGAGGWTTGLFAGRWLRANRAGQGVACGYQYGAIGPDMAMMIGAGAAVQRGVGPQAPYKGAPVLVVTSDAGIAYSMFEFDTAAKYKIPIITVVYNNNSWGMWPSAVGSARTMHMYLFQENLRYDKMAEGLGVHGEYVTTPEQMREALKRSYQIASKENVSSLINVQALKEFTSGRDYPPGIALPAEPGVGAFAH